MVEGTTIVGVWRQSDGNWSWEFKKNGEVKVTEILGPEAAMPMEYTGNYTMNGKTVDISFDGNTPFPSQFRIKTNELVSSDVTLTKMK